MMLPRHPGVRLGFYAALLLLHHTLATSTSTSTSTSKPRSLENGPTSERADKVTNHSDTGSPTISGPSMEHSPLTTSPPTVERDPSTVNATVLEDDIRSLKSDKQSPFLHGDVSTERQGLRVEKPESSGSVKEPSTGASVAREKPAASAKDITTPVAHNTPTTPIPRKPDSATAVLSSSTSTSSTSSSPATLSIASAGTTHLNKTITEAIPGPANVFALEHPSADPVTALPRSPSLASVPRTPTVAAPRRTLSQGAEHTASAAWPRAEGGREGAEDKGHGGIGSAVSEASEAQSQRKAPELWPQPPAASRDFSSAASGKPEETTGEKGSGGGGLKGSSMPAQPGPGTSPALSVPDWAPGTPGRCGCDGQPSEPTPQFQAAMSAVLTRHFGPDKDVIVPFDLELVDLAEDYDNESGVFFCSIPGTYVISVHLMSHPGSKVNARIFINNRPVAALWADDNKNGGFYPSSGIQTISRLAFGDQVYVMLVDGGYGDSWVHANYNVFTVFLLYEDFLGR